MKFIYKISSPKDTTGIASIAMYLPKAFSMEENDDGVFLTFEFTGDISDQETIFYVQREIERISFLTNIYGIEFIIEKKVNNDGTSTGYSSIASEAMVCDDFKRAFQRIKDSIAPQDWGLRDISIQLRLWFLSKKEHSEAAKIILLFQIIEIEYPKTNDNNQYPPYQAQNWNLHPRTESKLLRDIVSHGKKNVESPQLKTYCHFLEILTEMHDPTNHEFISKVQNRRIRVLEPEAHKIIYEKISKAELSQ